MGPEDTTNLFCLFANITAFQLCRILRVGWMSMLMSIFSDQLEIGFLGHQTPSILLISDWQKQAPNLSAPQKEGASTPLHEWAKMAFSHLAQSGTEEVFKTAFSFLSSLAGCA